MKDLVMKHGVGYDLVVTETADRLHLAIRCHKCQKVSYHPKDIKERYCGHCHVFHEESLLAHEG
jgi:hypothetical protein